MLSLLGALTCTLPTPSVSSIVIVVPVSSCICWIDLSTRANDGTNELLRNIEGNDARYVRLHLSTRLCDGLGQLAKDMLAASLGLQEGLLEDLRRKDRRT